MVVGDNRHILNYLKYDSSFSLLLIGQGGLFNISLNVDRISLFLDYLLFGSFGSLTDFLVHTIFLEHPRVHPGLKLGKKLAERAAQKCS